MSAPDLFEQHLDEAVFLWHQRSHALVSPGLTQRDTAALEWRLRRHLDGLVLAGTALIEKRLVPLLEGDEPDSIAIATLALCDEDVRRQELVLGVLREGLPVQRAEICRALQSRRRNELVSPLQHLLETSPPELQAHLLEVLAQWRALSTPLLEQFLAAREPQTRAAALRAVSALTTRPRPALVLDGLSSGDPSVRDEAMTAGLQLGLDLAWKACVQHAKRSEHTSARARLLMAMGGDAAEVALLTTDLSLSEPAELCLQTIWAAGFSGRVEVAEACLPLLSSREPWLARLAGEAFCAITGLRLEGRYLIGHEEELPEDALSNDESEAPTVQPPESQLPRPAPTPIVEWWQRARQKFSPEVRYLAGRPCTPDGLLTQLEEGSMRRRSATALELSLRTRGNWALPLRSFIDVQQRELERVRPLVPTLRMSTFVNLARMGALSPDRVAPPRSPPRQVPSSTSADTPVVTALGMITPLALGVVAGCAGASAGLVQASELEGCEAWDPVDNASHPVRGHSISWLTEGFTGIGRLVRLGEAALRNLLEAESPGDWNRTGLFVALPSAAHVQAHEKLLAQQSEKDEEQELFAEQDSEASARNQLLIEQRILPLLSQLAGLPIPQAQQRTFPQDATGFLNALKEAIQALHERKLDRCIVGGIDSLVEPQRLQALKALGLLKVPSQPARIMPGEAAAFLLLERGRDVTRRGAQALAVCEGIHTPSSQPVLWENPVKAGRMLTESILATFVSMAAQRESPHRIIGSLNGHERRAYAWGYALPALNSQASLGALSLWCPAESFGELGAATGPVAVCMAVRDFMRGATTASNALVWLMGDSGSVGSFHVRVLARERTLSGEIELCEGGHS